MTLSLVLYAFVTFIISFILVPLVASITKNLGIIAKVNERTVHSGIISRAGGYAIYIAFLIGATIFLKTDRQINSILISGFIVFLTGFIDDIYDLPPKLKLLGQVVAALVVIFYGNIVLRGLGTSFLPPVVSRVVATIITIGWIIGITNAINLIDGLDGLCAGISIIVLMTITVSSLHYGRSDIASLSMVMIGAILGFLYYNFHPASVFMGDCGALFIGFMIAVISLLGYGFKSSTFFTMGAPIVVLAVPIMDTLIAIIRRKIAGRRFDEADRGHLHHKLMFSLNLGQTKSVLILYGATALFSFASFLYIYNKIAAISLFLVLLLVFELFIEITDMISRQYKPVLTLLNIFIKSDRLPKIKTPEAYKKTLKSLVEILVVIAVVISCLFAYDYLRTHRQRNTTKITSVYKQTSNATTLMNTIYTRLSRAASPTNTTASRYVAAYFAVDYYTLSNKTEDQIGGLTYFYKDKRKAFRSYAKKDYYKTVNELIAKAQSTDEIIDYAFEYRRPSSVTLNGMEDYDYYEVGLTLTFNDVSQILGYKTIHVKVTEILKSNKYSVIALDYINGE